MCQRLCKQAFRKHSAKDSLSKWVPGSKQTRDIQGKRWDTTYKTTDRKNPLSMGNGKVNKTQLLASRSFSDEKVFKDRARASQIMAGEERAKACEEAVKQFQMAGDEGKENRRIKLKVN